MTDDDNYYTLVLITNNHTSSIYVVLASTSSTRECTGGATEGAEVDWAEGSARGTGEVCTEMED